MLTTNESIIATYKNPVRSIEAVIVYTSADGTVIKTWNSNNEIAEITYERVGEENKFFGFGVCQKVNIKLVDTNRILAPAANDIIQIRFINAGNTMAFSPKMKITEVRRDELTNQLSITAYDAIYSTNKPTVGELALEAPLTIRDYLAKAAEYLGLILSVKGNLTQFNLSFDDGANFDGTETIRKLLDAAAEATQTIYYINRSNMLVFTPLDKDGAAAYTIDKEQYFTLDSGTNRRLAAICHTTELGDSVEAKLEVSGTTQYIRDNPFIELREDVGALVETALELIGGLTINQFECEWRGTPLIEIGDKLAIITKDNETVFSYLLNDVITYDGTFKQDTRWHYEADTDETEGNPTNLGEALNKTFARVDKINKEIDIVAGESEANRHNIAALQLNTESIAASVSKIEETTNASFNGVNDELATLTNKVEAAMTAEGVKLSIQEELANGVDKVYTATGFSFDNEGLRVSKTGSEMETLLDEDGLTVYRDNTEVLTADNTGVNGINMTVRQYLIIGGSRFEAYGAGRTGCFWVG